jgi:hypothetical protein
MFSILRLLRSILALVQETRQRLDRIERNQQQMAVDRTALDAAIGTLTTTVGNVASAETQVGADVSALIAKIGTSPVAPDFANEVAALQASQASLTSAIGDLGTAHAAATEALAPPPAA